MSEQQPDDAPKSYEQALTEFQRRATEIFGRPHHWILDGHTPVPAPDLMTWARWFETAHRHVADTEVESPDGPVRVSTVCLGLDHSFSPDGPPLLFETLVFFHGGETGDMDRYSSWNDAEAGHARILAAVRELVDNSLLQSIDTLVELIFRKK